MKLDKVDKKILEVLKEYDGCNLSFLMLKVFSRESQKVFNERVKDLVDNNIITIKRLEDGFRSYLIEVVVK